MNDKKRLIRYLIFDFLSAMIAWQLFNILRFHLFRGTISYTSLASFLFSMKGLWMGLFVPLFWIVIYYFTGYYAKPRRKTNLGDLMNTSISTFCGVLILFFLIIINDYPEEPDLYYEVGIAFFVIHLIITFLTRFAQTAPLIVAQSKGRYCVPVLIIGTGDNAAKVLQDFNQYKSSFAYQLKGFVRTGMNPRDVVPTQEILGSMDDLDKLIDKYKVEELFYAIESQDPDKIQQLLDRTYKYRIPMKAFANRQDILAGKVSLFSLFGIPMVNLTPKTMPTWQYNFKNCFDKILSFIVLVLLLPLYIYLSIRVRMSSKGCVFYTQERIGKHGKVFNIYKFRTMFIGSEPDGPLLSQVDDPRVTPYGRFMRKYRLDELPQFWNVLKGDMSLVGPRPERKYFVDQIVRRAPHYFLIQSVLPGVTSWGMVKFGYANTVEKMIKRLEYDIIYLENQSLLIDLKILVFTLKPLFSGKGQ